MTKLKDCCLRHVTQVGVISPTTCPTCGTRLTVRSREWQEIEGQSASKECVAREARIAELEVALQQLATGMSWASNGFDLDGEFRLSRRAMKGIARRALVHEEENHAKMSYAEASYIDARNRFSQEEGSRWGQLRWLCRLGSHRREYDYSNCGLHGWSQCERCGR